MIRKEGFLPEDGAGYVSAHEITKFLGIGTTTFYRLSKRADFPESYSLSPHCTRWKKDEILDFMESIKREKAKAKG
jgi:predicted DNA-binding transcriptional regulator AlpA